MTAQDTIVGHLMDIKTDVGKLKSSVDALKEQNAEQFARIRANENAIIKLDGNIEHLQKSRFHVSWKGAVGGGAGISGLVWALKELAVFLGRNGGMQP